MADTPELPETRTLDQLPRATAVSPDALTGIQEPGGPMAAATVKVLLGRLISTETAQETEADLQLDLDYDEPATSLVYADPAPAKNGWYRKVDVAGAGNWVQFEKLSAYAADEVGDLVGEASASAHIARDAATSLAETDTIGRAIAPVDGISGTSNTRIFNQPVARSGWITKTRLFSSLTGSDTATLKLKVATRVAGPGELEAGDAVTLVDAAEVTITGGGLQEFDVFAFVEAGQFVGWHHSVLGAVDYLSATPSDSGGFWSDSGAVGDNLAMTVNAQTTNAQWQIGFDVSVFGVVNDRLGSVEGRLATLAETDTVGRGGVPVTGSESATLTTRAFAEPVARSGRIKKVRLFSLLTGANIATLRIKIATRDAGPGELELGDAITLTNGAVLTITGGGYHEFDVDIAVTAGQFLGWYSSATKGIAYLPATTSDSGGFWSDTGAVGDNLTMTVDSLFDNSQWQIGFDIDVPIEAAEIVSIRSRADFAYAAALTRAGQKQRPIPGIAADIDWAMCVSADFITPGREVGADGGVLEWLDRSGNGNTLASTTQARPVYDPDAFGIGIPGVQFIGGDDGAGTLRVLYLQHTLKLAGPFTLVAIVQIPSVNTAELRLVDGYSDAAASDRCAIGLATGAKPYIGLAPAQTIVSPDAISADAPHLLIGTFNGGASSIAVDGVVEAEGTITGGLDGLIFGCGRGGAALWNGAVAMKGIVNGTLSASQIAALEAYAAARYGITIS